MNLNIPKIFSHNVISVNILNNTITNIFQKNLIKNNNNDVFVKNISFSGVNIGEEKEMPNSNGLEKYFDVNNEGKTIVHDFFYNEKEIKKTIENFANDKNLFYKLMLVKDNEGNIPLHFANESMINEIINFLHDKPEYITTLLFQKNNKGQTPAHTTKILYGKGADWIIDSLKDNDEILEKLLLSKDKNDVIPFHNDNWSEKIFNFLKEKKTELLKKILFSKTKNGNLPLQCVGKERLNCILDYIKTNSQETRNMFLINSKGYDDTLNISGLQTYKELIKSRKYTYNWQETRNYSTLFLANRNKSIDIINFLKNNNLDVLEILLKKDWGGFSALNKCHKSLEKNEDEFFNELKDKPKFLKKLFDSLYKDSDLKKSLYKKYNL